LAYADAVDRETSLVVCNESRPVHGKGYLARELGVPVVSDAKFMDCVGTVVTGTGVEDFIDAARAGEQFALF
jgi:DNA polymerase III subunit epsilon